MAQFGINSSVSFNDGAGLHVVTGAKDFSLSISGTEVDITRLGDDFQRNVKTLRQVTGSVSGTFIPSDSGTADLVAAGNAAGTAAEGIIQYRYASGIGYDIDACITNTDLSINPEGVVEFTCNFTLDSGGDGFTLVS